LEQGKTSKTDSQRIQQLASLPTNFSGFERDRFWFREQGKFYPAGYASGLDFDTDGRATATIDFDGDGDLDVITLSRQRLRLLENRNQNSHHHIRFSIVQPNGQAALGAEIEITSNKVGSQKHYVKTTSGFATGVLPIIHFGLGGDKSVTKAVVRWPDHSEDVFANLAAGRHWKIEKNKKPVRLESPRWVSRLEDRFRVRRYTIPNELQNLNEDLVKLPVTTGPRIVTFWASWCEGCKKEHPELVRFAKTKQAQVIGISVDQDLEKARKFASSHPTPFRNYFANDKLVKNFFGDSREIQLPATFVFDARGKLTRAFFYPVSQEGLSQAVKSSTEVRLQKGDATSLRHQARKLIMLGKRSEALKLHQQALRVSPNSATAQMTMGFIKKADGMLVEARRHFEKARKIAPEYAAPYVALADLELRRGKFRRAKVLYEQALKMRPNFMPAVRGRQRAIEQLNLKLP